MGNVQQWPHDFVAGWADERRVDERARMVERQIVRRGVQSERVLAAMRAVAREHFVLPEWSEYAYANRALPIAYGQTISQPYIVALMSELSGAGPGSRVLEVGTGSGYQTAVLAAMGADVYTIGIIEPLAREVHRLFAQLGVAVHARVGDGHAGWPEAAPFDAIVVTAAPVDVPTALLAQLAIGGRMVVPVGMEEQELYAIRRTATGYEEKRGGAVRFVPMTGGASFTRHARFDTL